MRSVRGAVAAIGLVVGSFHAFDARAEDTIEDHIIWGSDVSALVKVDSCAKEIGVAGASAAFQVIMDQGVDWTDAIEVDQILRVSGRAGEPSQVWNVIAMNMAFQFQVSKERSLTRCEVSEPARLATVQDKRPPADKYLSEIFELGQTYLGRDFFPGENLGGARHFAHDWDAADVPFDAVLGVSQASRDWLAMTPEDLSLEADTSKEGVTALVRDHLRMMADPSIPETGLVQSRLVSLITDAVAVNKHLRIISGFDGGDDGVNLLALVDTRKGTIVVLRQGAED
jgi:hypothetical protein